MSTWLAIGDALGAPVEFLRLQEIKERYGKDGITDFHEWGGFKPGSYTDDTQMSLATAVGCIRAYQRWSERGICHLASVVHRRLHDHSSGKLHLCWTSQMLEYVKRNNAKNLNGLIYDNKK